MDGRTAVVIGADGDLGAAVARRFAADGALVVAGGRDRDALDELAADADSDDADETGTSGADGTARAGENGTAGTRGGRIVGVRADARDEYDVERLLERAARESDGGVDAVAACAEVDHADAGGTPLAEESYAAFDDTLRTNVRGAFAAVREAVPHLADDARVLIPANSAGGDGDPAGESRPGHGSYAVSKAAAVALTRTFASELDAAVGVVDTAGSGDGTTDAGNGAAGGADDPGLETVADAFAWAASEAPREAVDGEVVEPSAVASG